MPIQEFTGKLSNLDNDFLNKKVHIICPAVNGLTTYNAFAHAVGNMPNDQVGQIANTVNSKNETGTLYPRLNLTMIPLTIFENRNDFNNEKIMQKHISDCFESEEKYIKARRMIFVFEERSDFDNELALKVLIENWGNSNNNIEYLPK